MILIICSSNCVSEFKVVSSVGESTLLKQLQEVGITMTVYLRPSIIYQMTFYVPFLYMYCAIVHYIYTYIYIYVH